ELIELLGKEKYELAIKKPHKIMFVGLYGSGKTTSISKLAFYYSKRGYKACMIGLDIHRPAAPEQLKQLAEKNHLTAFVEPKEKNALKIWKKYEKELKKYDLVLVDTAGRHTLDKELIKEIKDLGKEISPTETILVLPADIGQAAKKQTSEFQQALKISGVIITRMDSTAKAGGALTACAETQAPVYFIATGEKINDLEEFNPESFLSRLLGMGDLQTLIEKIKSVTKEDEQEKLQKKLEEGKLSLEDVIEQVKSMSSLGGFDKIKSMIPGLGNAKIPENLLGTQEEKVKKWEHILKSMTVEEKENPELLKKQTSRISRIAKGAGVNGSDVRSLLKQYEMLQEMMKGGIEDMDMSQGFSQKQMQKMMKKFGGKKLRRMR
ncbi:MAG: signal recognition particle protein Srp19, partial [Nanoarchaeota archaeon]|nr:signal recognition particle protein Srp19 [Nanoarchaeota archaeon]